MPEKLFDRVVGGGLVLDLRSSELEIIDPGIANQSAGHRQLDLSAAYNDVVDVVPGV